MTPSPEPQPALPAPLHRVGQFVRHSLGRVSPAEAARAAEILGPGLAHLFAGLPLNEQRHGLDVLKTMDRLGERDRLVQQAALLHDMGKAAAGVSVLDRSIAVFLGAVSRRLWSAYLQARPRLNRRYALYRDHAAVGAARLRAVGANELAAVIAEHHQPAPTLETTRRLRQADRVN